MLEFSNSQTERIDEIHNAVFDLCMVLTEKDDLEWDMAYIGEIADVACEILRDCGFQIRYPAMLIDENGDEERIVDYYGEE